MRAVRVKVGRLLLVDPHRLVFVRAAEALLEDRAREQVAKLGLDHGAGPSELDVLDGDDLQQLAVHLEHRAVAKIARRDHCLSPSPRPCARARSGWDLLIAPRGGEGDCCSARYSIANS